MRFKPGIRELPLLLAVVLFGLELAPPSPTSHDPLPFVLLQALAFPLSVIMLVVQLGCWFRSGSLRLRRWLAGGLLLAGVMALAVRFIPGSGPPGRIEVLHAADDIWADANRGQVFSLSPDRSWLVFGRVPRTDRYRLPGPVEVVARNLNSGEERSLIRPRDESDRWDGALVLGNLDEASWAADTLIVREHRAWRLLVPGSGEVIEAPLRSRLPLRPSVELFRRIKSRFAVPGMRSDVAWDGTSLGGFLYHAEEGRGAMMSARLCRTTRDGRSEALMELRSHMAAWSISDIAVSPNGRWAALRAVRTPRFSPCYLFFVLPIIGYHGVDHLVVVDTATGESWDYGEYSRLLSLQWLPGSRHLVYLEDEMGGATRVEILELPATDIDPDEPRVAWDGRRETMGVGRPRSRSSLPYPPQVRRRILPVGWVSIDFGAVGFSYPGDRFRLGGKDSTLVLTREVDGQTQVAYELDLNAEFQRDDIHAYGRLGPVPGYGLEMSLWLTDRPSPDPSRDRIFLLPRRNGRSIRLVQRAGWVGETDEQMTYRILDGFDLEGGCGY